MGHSQNTYTRFLGFGCVSPPSTWTNLLLYREQFFKIYNPSPASLLAVHVNCERPKVIVDRTQLLNTYFHCTIFFYFRAVCILSFSTLSSIFEISQRGELNWNERRHQCYSHFTLQIFNEIFQTDAIWCIDSGRI